MSERLPELVDPLRLAAQRQLLSGQLALSCMLRLAPTLANLQGAVTIQLEFGQDEQNIKYLRGQIQANLELICQRCLQPMDFSIEVEPCLGMVTSSSQMDRLPDHYEPLLVETELMTLAAIIEDELLLSLPAIPKHAYENCLDLKKFTGPGPEAGTPRKNPFILLSELKDRKLV